MCFLSSANREEFHWHCFKFILFKEIKSFIFTILKVTFSDNCVNGQYFFFFFAFMFVKLEISASLLKPREICSCIYRDVFINAWIFKASSIVASIIKELQNLCLALLILFQSLTLSLWSPFVYPKVNDHSLSGNISISVH